MNKHETEDYVISKLIKLQYNEETIVDIINHLRYLNISEFLVSFLISYDAFIWYVLNTYEWMCGLRNRGIGLNTYYSIIHKHPKSHFVVNSAQHPITLPQTERISFWHNLSYNYAMLLNNIT